jgi:hypothetical protein
LFLVVLIWLSCSFLFHFSCNSITKKDLPAKEERGEGKNSFTLTANPLPKHNLFVEQADDDGRERKESATLSFVTSFSICLPHRIFWVAEQSLVFNSIA